MSIIQKAESPFDGQDDLLTLTEVTAELNRRLDFELPYTRLQSLVEDNRVKMALGAVTGIRGQKGASYPRSSLSAFEALVRASHDGEVFPKNAFAWLTKVQGPIRQKGESDNALAVTRSLPPESVALLEAIRALPSELQTVLAETIAHHVAHGVRVGMRCALPAPEDELLTAVEAAAILRCKPGTVRSWVKSVRRGRWRRSDVMRAIRDMQTKGELNDGKAD